MKTDILVTLVLAVIASTGFWQFLSDWLKSRRKKLTVSDQLLLGIAHNSIHYQCRDYIEKGYMTEEEYDTLKSICEPYIEMGGNGSGKKLYEQCQNLPIREEE